MSKPHIHALLYDRAPLVTDKRLHFSRTAYDMLPGGADRSILDMGCGNGQVTLELAAWTQGNVVGIDIDRAALIQLLRGAEERRLEDRVRVVHASMRRPGFRDESFDIVWAEGSIHVIGFEAGLRDWRRLLKPDGCLAVHEMTWLRPDPPAAIKTRWRGAFPGIRTAQEYVAQIPDCGYRLVGYFKLPEDFWWNEFYLPLERRIAELEAEHGGDRDTMLALENERRDVELYRQHSSWYGSAFYMMQRAD
ncbi:MAG: class I SAM-dependent methyltransferase [Gemmatimonadota bacterium]|nr:MAG: class I SAM-dependent methyltransferase [Gemmatimonadota bacterium]